MIDLKKENKDLFESNLNDEALNDELGLLIKNSEVFPVGEFCFNCAYALKEIGKHPITR